VFICAGKKYDGAGGIEDALEAHDDFRGDERVEVADVGAL
jgi:hypothetical protein